VSALLGRVATATQRVRIGTLVLRASLRPPATSESIVATAARIAPGRTIIGVGAGDSESREENDTFGLDFASMSARLTRLGETVRAIRDRGAPIWVGGIAKEVRGIAAREADGWNAWGLTPERFAEHAAEVMGEAGHTPFECSWSGLVIADDTDAHAESRADELGAPKNSIVGGPETIARAFRALHETGASWVIVGAVDAANPRTAHILGEQVMSLLV
jgi:alkanesulfonate monooxygenase SsuD/methylene tetrahydromethanopterin reductase-like flavin-dependent oxidoreductase (luciferase family)